MGKIISREQIQTLVATRQVPLRENTGVVMVTRDQLKDHLQKRREQITKPVSYRMGVPNQTNQRDEAGAKALAKAVGESSGNGNGWPEPKDVTDMEIPARQGPPGFGEVALALFDIDKDLLSKIRLPRRVRILYSRAITAGQHFNLLSILNFVYMDLTLTIPEDGKRIKEFLTPFEHALNRENKIRIEQGRPEI